MEKNISHAKESDINFTMESSEIVNEIKYEEWIQVISDNDTTEDLPHYIIPKISNVEKGENWKFMSSWRCGATQFK